MTMHHNPPASRSQGQRARLRLSCSRLRGATLRLGVTVVVGCTVPLLASCGSSGGNLIPVADAGPLQGDFEAVARAAENGDGSCTATETAILKTEEDFSALPSSVDEGLRERLHEGIVKLRTDALSLCKEPLPQSTDTTPKTTTSTRTTATTPTTTPTTTTPTTPTITTAPSGPGGGTPAPGVGGGEVAPGSQQGATGAGQGAGGATGSESNGAGAGAGGQESGK